MKTKLLLPGIIVAQFCCTSLWFAGNGVMADLLGSFALESGALGHLTSAVQFGFIAGTLIFAVLTIADRFSPSKVFLWSALLGALFNLGITWDGNSLTSLLCLRFLTGFCLAGIYPVGMKIAADHFDKGLGKSLGFLVGALVLGTALPHLLRDLSAGFAWQSVLYLTSLLALLGGLLLGFFVPDGPFRRAGQHVKLGAFFAVFREKNFRSAAFGYFGHMWELYAFWAFVPVLLQNYGELHPSVGFNIPLLAFAIIGIGSLACVLGGYLAQVLGNKRTAAAALALSALCCLLVPIIFSLDSDIALVVFLLLWGMVVIADSPLFSTLVAQNAPAELKGTALTIVNCIGFSITIVSIQLLSYLLDLTGSVAVYTILALGPILGLIFLFVSGRETQRV